MKYFSLFILLLVSFLLQSCSKEDDMIPEQEIEEPSIEYICKILAQIRSFTLVDGSTGEANTLFDTLNYAYNENDNLIRREFGNLDYDSLTYKNGNIDRIYKIKDGHEIIQESIFEYNNSNTLIKSTHEGENWYGIEVDSFFYNTSDNIKKIATYRKFYFNVQECESLTLKQEIIFVFDDENKLIRDTIKTYDDCDENLRSRDLTITEYSDHSNVKNPLYRSPFREHYRTSVNQYIIGRNDYVTYVNNTQSATGYFSINPNLIEYNEYGYPMNGYIFECKEL